MRLLLPLLLVACSASQTDRTALMQQVLVADNAVYRSRNPALLQQKYARMAADPYDFMRGTATWFYTDVSRPNGPRSTAGDAADAGRTLLVGDPHPENLGTIRTGDVISVEWVDLDAVTWGPWTLDVRRAALGLTALTAPLDDCACTEDALRAFVDGYRSGLTDPTPPYGAIVNDVIEEAIEEGDEQRRLMRRTEVVDGTRRFLRTDGLDDDGRGMLDIPASEEARTTRVISHMAPDEWCVSDVVQRFGSGIASLPAERLNLLASPCDRDEPVLLQVREVFDPPPIPQPLPTAPPFESNAQRLLAGFSLQAQLDPVADTCVDGPIAYKLTSAGSGFQTLDHERVAEHWADGRLTSQDLIDLGYDLGHALAAAHHRSTSTVQAATLLHDELVSIALADHQRLFADYLAFQALLDTAGPVLGADALVQP